MHSSYASCPDLWSPVCHSSPEYLERYWLTYLKVPTKNIWCPNLLTFQHVARPGYAVNPLGYCQSFGFLVVYQLHFFILLDPYFD